MPRVEPGKFFDERAASYDRAYDRPGGHGLRTRVAAVRAALGAGPGDVLDAGMGPGRLLVELVRDGWTVSGLDASAEMVAAARSRLPEAAGRLVQAEIESLPFADESFDAVVATGVLEYSEIERALGELARVLRPGGTSILSYPNPNGLYGIWKVHGWYGLVRTAKRIGRRPPLVAPGRARAIQPERFSDLLTGAGLRRERMQYLGFAILPAPLDELLPRTNDHLARRFEGSGPRVARRLADQILYVARKD